MNDPITGEVYGKLIVLAHRKRSPHGTLLFHVKCLDCNYISYKNKHQLLNMPNRCGDCYRKRSGIEIKAGDRLGLLTVTGKIKIYSKYQQKFEALCDCGNRVYSNKCQLIKRKFCNSSCIVLRSKIDPQTGDKFGQWIVLSGRGRNTRNITFQCKCICGTIKFHKASTLKRMTDKFYYCKKCSIKSEKLALKPGQKFHSWTVIPGTDKPSNGTAKRFRVRCNCGFERFHYKTTLVNGISTQCLVCYRAGIKGRTNKSKNKFIPKI